MENKSDMFFIGVICGVFASGIFLIALDLTPPKIEKKMQKEAIVHGAARYEVDTNGVVSFKWNK